jgi:cobalamin synthase
MLPPEIAMAMAAVRTPDEASAAAVVCLLSFLCQHQLGFAEEDQAYIPQLHRQHDDWLIAWWLAIVLQQLHICNQRNASNCIIATLTCLASFQGWTL